MVLKEAGTRHNFLNSSDFAKLDFFCRHSGFDKCVTVCLLTEVLDVCFYDFCRFRAHILLLFPGICLSISMLEEFLNYVQ